MMTNHDRAINREHEHGANTFRNVKSTFEGLIEALAPGPHACLTTELLTIIETRRPSVY